jgi:hypothetical protein
MDHQETMSAEQAPDIYDGPSCDGIRPRWISGSRCGDEEVGTDGVLSLRARTFPPGTQVKVMEPVCPECGETPVDAGDLPDDNGGWFTHWRCGCDFDWRAFALEHYQ